MAEEFVVKEILTNEMINAGRLLLEQMDKIRERKLSAAFWFYVEEKGDWQLILVSDDISEGPLDLYTEVLSILQKEEIDESAIVLRDVSVRDLNYPLVRLLKGSIKTDGVKGVRFTRNAIEGHFIEDTYIYRM